MKQQHMPSVWDYVPLPPTLAWTTSDKQSTVTMWHDRKKELQWEDLSVIVVVVVVVVVAAVVVVVVVAIICCWCVCVCVLTKLYSYSSFTTYVETFLQVCRLWGIDSINKKLKLVHKKFQI